MKAKHLLILLVVIVIALIFCYFIFPLHRNNYEIRPYYNENGNYVCLRIEDKEFAHLYQYAGYRYNENESYPSDEALENEKIDYYRRILNLYLARSSAQFFKDKSEGLFLRTNASRPIGSAEDENIYFDASIKLPRLSIDEIDYLQVNEKIIRNEKEINKLIDRIKEGAQERYLLKKYKSIFDKDEELFVSIYFKGFKHLWFEVGQWESNEGEPYTAFVCDYQSYYNTRKVC